MFNYKVTKEILDSEKVTRKRTIGFIKKLLGFVKIPYYYPTFKAMIYAEDEPKSRLDIEVKAIYDSYVYLISNSKQKLTKEVLNKFLYIMKQEEFYDDEIMKIQTAYYYPSNKNVFEKIVDFHFKLEELLYRFEEKYILMIMFMMLNYALLNNDYCSVQISFKQFHQYKEIKEKYFNGERKDTYDFFYQIVTNQLNQSKDFYDQLKEISKEEIVNQIKQNKQKIQEKYKFKKMFIFGSIASSKVRFDSDIDLLVEFEEEVDIDDKRKYIDEFSKEYQKIFNRFIDIHELGKFVNEILILTINEAIEIY